MSHRPIWPHRQYRLFYYLMHFALLFGLMMVLPRGGLAQTYIVAFVVIVALYPACRWYRGKKREHPQSVLRFI